MSDDWVNDKTLQVIGEYSMMHDIVTLDGVAYVCEERYKPYYEENAARLERERILNVIMEERCDCSEDCDRIDTHLEYLLDRIKNV